MHVSSPEALSVLDPSTGEFLKHRQLHRDPCYKATWDMSYANELRQLCQGIGIGSSPNTKRVAGTNTFFLIDYHDIPIHKRKEICHTMVVCEVRLEKDDPDCTRITIGGNHICFPGDVGTNTVSLELVKLLLNSVLSCPGAHFSSMDIKNFYLDILMPDPEYVRIKIADIPLEFIEEYNLQGCNCDSWIYFKIHQGCYGLPQASILANDLLRSHILAEGYYKAESTPGLWNHKWRPIQFCLIVDDFGVENVGLEYFSHLRNVLKKFHGVQFNMAGNKFASIDIKWDFAIPISVASVCPATSRTFSSSLNIPIQPNPVSCDTNACQSPMVLRPNSPQRPILQSNLTYTKKCRIQEIVGLLLYYAQAVNNKLLVALSAIAA
jgi:hypothetical protein